jgi:D-lactate dehydrogenase (cytochrome)
MSLAPSILEPLAVRFGERFTTAPSIREHHGKGEDWFSPMPPDAVVFPHTTEEVAEIVKVCAAHQIPIIPWGTGTSLEGHVLALNGGITIDLSEMREILEVNSADLDCRVQAGVTRKQLNEKLGREGMFFPVDPGADASLGGMTATNASGTNAVRYGTMRTNVLGLTVVMPDGSIVKTGGRARKSSAGYDLTRLFVGSEGTLGIITEIQLRVYGIPEAITSAVCQFDSLGDAVNSVIMAIQLGIPMARIELLDEVQMRACIAFSNLTGYAETPTLFFEFHGTEASVREQAELMNGICEEHRGNAFQWAIKPEERAKLWEARHNSYYAGLALAPGKRGIVTDVCVPISRLAECILATKADIEAVGVIAPLVGHVGDGNFHLVILCDPDDPEDVAKAKTVAKHTVQNALAVGGTCTGEHGVGIGKMAYLEQEHGDALEVMRTIKRALDPQNIMNPGKVVKV